MGLQPLRYDYHLRWFYRLTGYLSDGAAVDCNTYADLFTVCGTTYAGDGSTTNLPDFEESFVVGMMVVVLTRS